LKSQLTYLDTLKLKRPVGPVRLTEKEIRFLEQNELCRFATASKKENPHAAILVDTAGTQKLLLISGSVSIIEKGEEYRKLYKIFHSKLDWVKRDPWKEGEAPFVRINPTFKAGWGLRGDK
jgi:hypothetical protein